MRRDAEPDRNKDDTVLNRGSADHMLVLFLDVLRHQRVDTSSERSRPNTSRIMLTVLTIP